VKPTHSDKGREIYLFIIIHYDYHFYYYCGQGKPWHWPSAAQKIDEIQVIKIVRN